MGPFLAFMVFVSTISRKKDYIRKHHAISFSLLSVFMCKIFLSLLNKGQEMKALYLGLSCLGTGMSERIGLMKQKKLCDDIKVCLWKKNTKTRLSKNKVFILAFL